MSKPDRPPELTFGHAVTVPHDGPYVGGAQGSEEDSRMASWRQRFQVEIFKGSAKVSLVWRGEGNSTSKALKRGEDRYRRKLDVPRPL